MIGSASCIALVTRALPHARPPVPSEAGSLPAGDRVTACEFMRNVRGSSAFSGLSARPRRARWTSACCIWICDACLERVVNWPISSALMRLAAGLFCGHDISRRCGEVARGRTARHATPRDGWIQRRDHPIANTAADRDHAAVKRLEIEPTFTNRAAVLRLPPARDLAPSPSDAVRTLVERDGDGGSTLRNSRSACRRP